VLNRVLTQCKHLVNPIDQFTLPFFLKLCAIYFTHLCVHDIIILAHINLPVTVLHVNVKHYHCANRIVFELAHFSASYNRTATLYSRLMYTREQCKYKQLDYMS